MPTVTVFLAKALICFGGLCHHALVGTDTPLGTYQFQHVLTKAAGYGGDVLVFKGNRRYIWAVHRVYLLNKKQHRAERLASDDPLVRRITMGCINTSPAVYEELVKCCSRSKLVIKP